MSASEPGPGGTGDREEGGEVEKAVLVREEPERGGAIYSSSIVHGTYEYCRMGSPDLAYVAQYNLKISFYANRGSPLARSKNEKLECICRKRGAARLAVHNAAA